MGTLAWREGIAINKKVHQREQRASAHCTLNLGKKWLWRLHCISLSHSYIKVNSEVQWGREEGCPDIYFSQGLIRDLAREHTREAVRWPYREQCRGAGHPG